MNLIRADLAVSCKCMPEQVVFETSEFMASFIASASGTNRAALSSKFRAVISPRKYQVVVSKRYTATIE